MASSDETVFGLIHHRSSNPSLLECIEMRNWQKAIDVISADKKAVYQPESKRRTLNNHHGIEGNTNNGNGYNNNLAIHELCKIVTSPTSVRFSRDEFSDDEEGDEEDDIDSDDDDNNNNDNKNDQETQELDRIFDACELEEGTKIHEVTQFMIDVSHSLGPFRFALSRNQENSDDDSQNDLADANDGENNNNINNELGPIERNNERDGAEDNNDNDHNDGGDNDRNGNDDPPRDHDENDESRIGYADNNNGNSSNNYFVTHQSILTVKDSMGKTPLHVLCEHSCDSNMMRVILGSTRETTGNPCAPTALSLILAKDSRGSTPLHYLAYSRQCPFSSLKLMMEYCKPRPSSHNHSYHDSSSHAMEDEPLQQQQQRQSRWIDPTLCVDEDGETPLHWALAGYVSSRRIKELTRHSLDAITVQNGKGTRPFDQFTANFVDSDWTDHDVCGHEMWENIQEYLRVIHDNYQCIHNSENRRQTISAKPTPDSSNGRHHNPHSRRFERRGSDGYGNSRHQETNESEWLPLHFIAGSTYDFPPIFTDLALKYRKHDLQKTSARGMLPLHLACGRENTKLLHRLGSMRNAGTNNANNNTTNTNNNGGADEQRSDHKNNSHNSHAMDLVAMKILKSFPRASLVEARSTKQLALHLAVLTHKPMALIAALIRTYPRSLNIPDPVTKLWPYALAGLKRENDADNNNGITNDNSFSNESLSVSFALIRADPSVLHLVRKNNNDSINNLTDKERSRWKKNAERSSYLDEESKSVDESYMEHSSRRIRRLSIRDD